MVFTNAIDNQIPNSVLRGQGYDSFNISPARKREMAAEEEFGPLADLFAPAASFLAGGTLAAPLIDTALMSARGLGKGLSVIPGLGPEFARGVERTIPEPFVQRGIENALLLGERENIARRTGELPFMLGGLAGAITSGAGLAQSVPKLGALFGGAFDIASGTPGATGFLEGATTAGQAIGRGAAIGTAGSILPAIDVAYNAQQGVIDPMAGLATLGFGAALGAGIPALPTAAAKGGQYLSDLTQSVRKKINDSDLVKTMQSITKRRFEAQQAQQMAVQKQMEQMPFENPLAPLKPYERQGVPEPVDLNRFRYDEQGNLVLRPQPVDETAIPRPQPKPDTFVDEVTLDKDISAETYTNDVTQMEKDLDYVAKEIGNLRKKKVTLTKDEYQEEKALYKQLRDKEKEYNLDPSLDVEYLQANRSNLENELKLLQRKQNEINTANDKNEDDYAKAFQLRTTGKTAEEKAKAQSLEKTYVRNRDKNASKLEAINKQIEEKQNAIVSTSRSLAKYKEVQTLQQQAQEFRTSRIAEREQAKADDLATLEALGEELLTRYDQTTAKYKQEQEYLGGLQQLAQEDQDQYLARLAQEEAQSRSTIDAGFILEPSGTRKEPLYYSPKRRGEKLPVRYVEPQTATPTAEVKPVAPEVAPKAAEATATPTAEAIALGASVEEKVRYSAKDSVNRISPITNMVSRLSKKVGAAFNDFAVRPGIYRDEFLNQLKPLIDVVKKYSKDSTVMKNLGNINNLDYTALPKDLAQALEAAQPIFKAQAEELNKKGMDIDLTDKIYFPRGWSNIDELQTRIGSIAQRESEFRGAPISMKNRMLSRELEKSKTIPEVTDDIIDLFDPMQGIANWIENTAEKKAEADLFGNATGKYEENISNLLLKYKDDFKSKEDVQKAMNTMIKAFESQNINTSPAYKLYSGLVSGIVFTGDTTALSQLNDAFLSIARNGLLNTFSGITNTIGSLFPSYKGPMKDILKRTGMMDSVAAYTDIGQLDKFADFFGLLKKKQFSEAIGAAAGNAGLALNKVNYWRTRITDALGKKANITGRHERLKNNPDLIWDDINEFQPDAQKQQEIFNYYKDLKDNYKAAKYKPMSSDTAAYLLNSALKYHVKTQFDRNIGSITGNDIERMANFTMSFANKFAATAKDDFAKLSKEVITGKNPTKTAKKLLEAAAGISVVIGGGIALALMKGGFGEEGLPVTPEAIQKAGIEFAAGSVVPVETRIFKGYQNLKEANAPDSKVAAVVNTLFPGLPTASKSYTDAIQAFSEGGFADVYNPELNPSFRYMPPRIATDYFYSQSDEYKRNMAKKATQAQIQPFQEQKTIDDLNTRANNVLQYKSVLDQENVKLLQTREVGSNAYRTALKRLEEEKKNLGTYGTNDPQTVANAQTQKLLADAQITRNIQIAIDAYNDGAINQEEYLTLRRHYRAQMKALGIR